MYRYLLSISILFVCSIAFTQAEKKPSAEEIAVRKVVDELFAGMKAGDSSIVHGVFHPNARLSTSFLNRDKKAVCQIDSISEFLVAVGTPHKEVWNERIHDVEIRVDGTMATVWAPYQFFVNEDFSHCGVNAFQLVLGENGWKILNLTDTRRATGCN